jgi:hypothetical protein
MSKLVTRLTRLINGYNGISVERRDNLEYYKELTKLQSESIKTLSDMVSLASMSSEWMQSEERNNKIAAYMLENCYKYTERINELTDCIEILKERLVGEKVRLENTHFSTGEDHSSDKNLENSEIAEALEQLVERFSSITESKMERLVDEISAKDLVNIDSERIERLISILESHKLVQNIGELKQGKKIAKKVEDEVYIQEYLVEGLEPKDIAEKHNMTPDNVRKNLHRLGIFKKG